ncbi:hypothetical protein C8R45DRAFT_1042215, partial [Mycena sanguinolenta]
MPGRPSLEFDNMTVKSAAKSKRGWWGAVPRSPSACSSSSRSTDESSNARSVVPGILSALAPAHEPRRRASVTSAQESWHRSRSPALESQNHLFVTTPVSPSPNTLSPYAAREPWASGRTSPSPSSNSGRSSTSTGPPEFLRRSPVPPRSPSTSYRDGFQHAPSPPLHLNTSYSPVSVPPPRSPHYVKASPTWNAAATFAPPTPTMRRTPTPTPKHSVEVSPRPSFSPSLPPDTPFVSVIPETADESSIASMPSRTPSPSEKEKEEQVDEQVDELEHHLATVQRKEVGWSGEWSGAQGMDDVVRSLRLLRV